MNTARKIRVLVVDDSAFMRSAIRRMLAPDPAIEIVGTAASGAEALELTRALRPDVVTLDCVLPDMNGIRVLREIMRERPTPVLILSRLADESASRTLAALGAGAVDFVPKPTNLPGGTTEAVGRELAVKIRAAAGVDPRVLASATTADAVPALAAVGDVPCGVTVIVVGASSGGPTALQRLLGPLPADFPAGIVIVQHIHEGFSAALAEQLDASSSIEVRHADDHDVVHPACALIAPAGRQMRFESGPSGPALRLSRAHKGAVHAPSIDAAMRSAAEVLGACAAGVLLTGMGSDGAQGLLAMRRAGSATIAEAASSAVVFGMPRAAERLGAAERMLDLAEIPEALVGIVADPTAAEPAGRT